MNDLISLCLRLTSALMGKDGSEWSRAMYVELNHVPHDDRLSWALGCVIAGMKWRIETMRSGNLRVSRGVLFLELLLCFLPITLGWWDAVFGASGVLGLNQSTLQDYFLATPLGRAILGMMIGGAVIGLSGPIGLFLTSRAVITGAGLRSRPLGIAMIAGVTLFILASILLRLIAAPGAYAANFSFVVLIGLLPVLGTAHLMYLSHTEPRAGLSVSR
ncbi:hypothetical protein [Peristeroidobacter soli]|uniref:hypothetical protein n=1 Tax=Peristeroidobacter soli TaxID=2497877 RepID=UPI00101D4E6D|nr:hypothetical protein [Peristeroidobacter soli]